MHISIKYMPDDEMTKKQKGLRVIGEAKYKMFPELYDEFNVGDYEREFEIEMNLMDPEKDKDGNEMQFNFFEYDLDLPYGDFSVKFKKKYGPQGNEKTQDIEEN